METELTAHLRADSPEPEDPPEPREEVVQQPLASSSLEEAVATIPDDDHDMLILEFQPGKFSASGTKSRKLDPRKFNYLEKDKFDKAAKENWDKHLELEAVKVISPKEALKVERERILRVPTLRLHDEGREAERTLRCPGPHRPGQGQGRWRRRCAHGRTSCTIGGVARFDLHLRPFRLAPRDLRNWLGLLDG